MSTWYWGLEYGKVLLGYSFFMFLWPAAVFGGHLKGKGITYRFSFRTTVQIVIANTVVLMLGLFHVLYPQVIMLLFYGVFSVSCVKKAIQHFIAAKKVIQNSTAVKKPKRHSAAFSIRNIWWKFHAGVGENSMLNTPLRFGRRVQHSIARRTKDKWGNFRAHMGEYSLLIILLLFGMVYFSYGAFQVHSYGAGDMYVHHAKIYGLQEGTIFSGGVYPEAMHCFIYCLNTLFGIRVFSCLMFFQGIHVAAFLFAGYLLMREIFHWRYTPLLALTLFLTLEVVNADLVCGLFRLQVTLPMEFGLHTALLCALYLVVYLKNSCQAEGKKRSSGFYWDHNLFLFFMSLAASVSSHFYTTMIAFVLCASFVVFMLKRLFSKERLIPLLASVLCACVIAVLPMAGALASGTPLNYSINRAVENINGEKTREYEGKDSSGPADEMTALEVLEGIYTEGYAALYGVWGGGVILVVTGLGVVLCLLSKRKTIAWLREICAGYPPLILFSFLYIFMYAAPLLNFPEVISRERLGAAGHMMMMALMLIPVDVIFSVLARVCRDVLLQAASVFSAAGIYVLALVTGHFHGYLFYDLSRYNAAVEVTNQIIEEFPEKHYMIVSPTDEIYQVIEYGWHEELMAFVQNSANENYALEAEYVFIFVEKRPLQYAQACFFDGPSWLAWTKYKDLYWDKYSKRYPDTGAVQAPGINASEISAEEAQKELDDENAWLSYTRLPSRTIIESKAYEWCQKFSESYPDKLNVYYEDDDFVCYYFRQDIGELFNLGLG